MDLAASQRGVVQFSHVLLEVEVAAESFRADFTRVRFFVVMRVHMESEIVYLPE